MFDEERLLCHATKAQWQYKSVSMNADHDQDNTDIRPT